VPRVWRPWRACGSNDVLSVVIWFDVRFASEAAEYHELASQSHRTAAEHNEKGDNETGNWHSTRALEYSNRAYELAMEAHEKSGRIETLS
jgi:hypothetical protein